MAVVDSGNSSLSQYLAGVEKLKLVESSDIEADIKNGIILAALEIPETLMQTSG